MAQECKYYLLTVSSCMWLQKIFYDMNDKIDNFSVQLFDVIAKFIGDSSVLLNSEGHKNAARHYTLCSRGL